MRLKYYSSGNIYYDHLLKKLARKANDLLLDLCGENFLQFLGPGLTYYIFQAYIFSIFKLIHFSKNQLNVECLKSIQSMNFFQQFIDKITLSKKKTIRDKNLKKNNCEQDHISFEEWSKRVSIWFKVKRKTSVRSYSFPFGRNPSSTFVSVDQECPTF